MPDHPHIIRKRFLFKKNSTSATMSLIVARSYKLQMFGMKGSVQTEYLI